MSFIRKIFGRKPAKVSEITKSCSIDIRGDCFVINGQKLEVPMHIDALTRILGKPRANRFKTDDDTQRFLETLHKEPVSNRVNYTWDELGLMCYTYNGKVVNTFGICIQPANNGSPSNPRALFGGTVTINGGAWLPVILAGEDKEVFREVKLGNYLITAEYTDFVQDDSTRDEKSFTGFEIQLIVNDINNCTLHSESQL